MGTLEAIKVKILIMGEEQNPLTLRIELTSENDLFFHFNHNLDEHGFRQVAAGARRHTHQHAGDRHAHTPHTPHTPHTHWRPCDGRGRALARARARLAAGLAQARDWWVWVCVRATA